MVKVSGPGTEHLETKEEATARLANNLKQVRQQRNNILDNGTADGEHLDAIRREEQYLLHQLRLLLTPGSLNENTSGGLGPVFRE